MYLKWITIDRYSYTGMFDDNKRLVAMKSRRRDSDHESHLGKVIASAPNSTPDHKARLQQLIDEADEQGNHPDGWKFDPEYFRANRKQKPAEAGARGSAKVHSECGANTGEPGFGKGNTCALGGGNGKGKGQGKVPVQVDDAGRIHDGPESMKGKHVDDLIDAAHEEGIGQISDDWDFGDATSFNVDEFEPATKNTKPAKQFVPKTRLDAALVDNFGDEDPELLEGMKAAVNDAHEIHRQEVQQMNDPLRQLLSHFGIAGRKLSGFLAAVKRVPDYDQIPAFDEMAQVARSTYPETLVFAGPIGASMKLNDDESALFTRLQQGFIEPLAKHSQEIIDKAKKMVGWRDPYSAIVAWLVEIDRYSQKSLFGEGNFSDRDRQQKFLWVSGGNAGGKSDCGANAPGGGGFQPGNTCAGTGKPKSETEKTPNSEKEKTGEESAIDKRIRELEEKRDEARKKGDLKTAAKIMQELDRLHEQKLAGNAEPDKPAGDEQKTPADPADDQSSLSEKLKESLQNETIALEDAIRETMKESDLAEAEGDPRKTAEVHDYYEFGEYEWAKKAEVGNAGEDLKGSARHSRNAWRSLEEAELNGTARKWVNRDSLLKAEDYPMSDKIADDFSNADVILTMHLAMKKFPAKPSEDEGWRRSALRSGKFADEGEYDKAMRKDYLDAFRHYRGMCLEMASADKEGDADSRLRKLGDDFRGYIQQYRSANPGLYNQLIKTYNGLRYGKTAVDRDVAGFANLLGRAYPGASERDLRFYGTTKIKDKEKAWPHVLAVLEGKTIDGAFGKTSTRSKEQQFHPSEVYVERAERSGGKAFDPEKHEANQQYMLKKMGLRGIQFGNSVTDRERKHHLAKCAEAFSDLADVTGIPVETISINGKLGMAFGARGRAGALAHYEPGSKVINLSRAGGVGSLAHEWGHFFDNLISGSATKFATDSRVANPELQSAVSGLKNAWDSTGFRQQVLAEVRGPNSGMYRDNYWETNIEMFARTFERWVQKKLHDSGRENTYLTGLRKQGHVLWPNDQQVDAMAPHFEKLMAHFKANAEKYMAIWLSGVSTLGSYSSDSS